MLQFGRRGMDFFRFALLVESAAACWRPRFRLLEVRYEVLLLRRVRVVISSRPGVLLG
jgi:hypothetical protein